MVITYIPRPVQVVPFELYATELTPEPTATHNELL